MGSLESGLPLKRDGGLFRSSSAGKTERNLFLQKPRSRFSRFFFLKKLDYLLWICTVAVFLFFVVVFQMFLPGSVIEKSEGSPTYLDLLSGDFAYLKQIGGLDFGEDVQFKPSHLLEKFQTEAQRELHPSSMANKTQLQRFANRKPQLALVFSDLLVEPQQLLMVTVATALQEMGYSIQVYSLEDGPVHNIWKSMGVPVATFKDEKTNIMVDWLNYDGIIVNSLEAKEFISSLMQEPFKSVPLIWTIRDSTLAIRLRQYDSSGQTDLIENWKKVFNRASVILFPNHVLPMMYAAFDAGNYYVVPGSPAEAWGLDATNTLSNENRMRMGYRSDDTVIVVAGSQFLYRGLWLEHALVLQALLPICSTFPLENNSSSLKIIVLSGNSNSNYSMAVEAIAAKLNYPSGVVKHKGVDEDASTVINAADLVIYGSFNEEQSFPEVIMKAMSMAKPVIAPDLAMIKKYVDDRVNGFLFPKDKIKDLTGILLQLMPTGILSPLVHEVASKGKITAKNLMVSETIQSYALLLQNVLKLPSEVMRPRAVTEIPPILKVEWRWRLFQPFFNSTYEDRALKSSRFLDSYEELWNHTHMEVSGSTGGPDDSFIYEIWVDQKTEQILHSRKRREEEELKDRTDQPRGTWEEVYRSARRADRVKNDLRERDEGELERTGQPLCIYEPYFGEGTWSFLHSQSLYRGIGLSTKGRRPMTDDIDAPARLQLLNDPYYRDTLNEYGAFFAIANRFDRVHKNAWIGFHSWRATARKASLSKVSENALLDAIQSRKYGDTLFFWVRMDTDPRNHIQQDFWSFCDAINAGNCKLAFSKALSKMYGIKGDLDSLPTMPVDGDTWSVMSSWAMPSRSFLEFVMFSRMFVDALDAEMYDEHRQSGRCFLSLYKDKHCYSRILELLVNVWAYHSARHMVYVNPETGVMHEQHSMQSRRGKMWTKWFSFATLKSMDEELAEEADSDHPSKRWLWPSTGEIFWQGMYEKERSMRNQQKEKRKQQSKDKLRRMKGRHRQKVLGKYRKPSPEEMATMENSTMLNRSRKL
ncbi:unnamed protein product [Linum tenue]|uniref:Glycosyl transferase family 1 domain-containing protein n=1 Tax=Linum tenue TaxID=586396 RepID=A0AAV0NPB1_9ROSI|nr:unnamed protein product [Linum tenue]